jgi:hypothetical protein
VTSILPPSPRVGRNSALLNAHLVVKNCFLAAVGPARVVVASALGLCILVRDKKTEDQRHQQHEAD